MTGNNPRAALRSALGNSDIQNVIESLDNTVDGAASCDIDLGITDSRQNLTGIDHFRVPEEDDAVAVAVCVRLMIGNDRFAVEPLAQFEKFAVVRIGWPCLIRNGSG